MNRLLEIGFEFAGRWRLDENGLSFDLVRHQAQHNILYAFVSEADVKYVGKTTKTLLQRMTQYQKPSPTQTTNVKNHRNIVALLQSGGSVEILALPDNGLLHFGQFHLNLAAGLEDSVIEVISPDWNGRQPARQPDRRETETVDSHSGNSDTAAFQFVLQPTYYNKGFFNVPTANSHLFGEHGEKIRIYGGDADSPFVGWIDRNANKSGTPRIMCGTQLRDWFQRSLQLKQEVTVNVIGPYEIRIGNSG